MQHLQILFPHSRTSAVKNLLLILLRGEMSPSPVEMLEFGSLCQSLGIGETLQGVKIIRGGGKEKQQQVDKEADTVRDPLDIDDEDDECCMVMDDAVESPKIGKNTADKPLRKKPSVVCRSPEMEEKYSRLKTSCFKGLEAGFKCPLCDMSKNRFPYMLEHLSLTHFREEIQAKHLDEISTRVSGGEFNCGDCGAAFPVLKSYVRHRGAVHGDVLDMTLDKMKGGRRDSLGGSGSSSIGSAFNSGIGGDGEKLNGGGDLSRRGSLSGGGLGGDRGEKRAKVLLPVPNMTLEKIGDKKDAGEKRVKVLLPVIPVANVREETSARRSPSVVEANKSPAKTRQQSTTASPLGRKDPPQKRSVADWKRKKSASENGYNSFTEGNKAKHQRVRKLCTNKEGRLECFICNRTEPVLGTLLQHLSLKHFRHEVAEKRRVDEEGPASTDAEGNKRWKCGVCQRELDRRDKVVVHYGAVHGDVLDFVLEYAEEQKKEKEKSDLAGPVIVSSESVAQDFPDVKPLVSLPLNNDKNPLMSPVVVLERIDLTRDNLGGVKIKKEESEEEKKFRKLLLKTAEGEDSAWRCNLCGVSTAKRKSMLRHLCSHFKREIVAEHNKEIDKLTCASCHCRLGKKNDAHIHFGVQHEEVVKHFLRHSEGKKKDTLKNDKAKDELSEILKPHCKSGADGRIKCPLCDRGFSNLNIIPQHLCLVHFKEEITKERGIDQVEMSGGSATCSDCDSVLYTKTALVLHYGTAHGDLKKLWEGALERKGEKSAAPPPPAKRPRLEVTITKDINSKDSSAEAERQRKLNAKSAELAKLSDGRKDGLSAAAHRCPVCKEESPLFCVLLRHMTTEHFEKEVKERHAKEIEEKRCDKCDLTFADKEIALTHFGASHKHKEAVEEFFAWKDKKKKEQREDKEATEKVSEVAEEAAEDVEFIEVRKSEAPGGGVQQRQIAGMFELNGITIKMEAAEVVVAPPALQQEQQQEEVVEEAGSGAAIPEGDGEVDPLGV